MAGGVRGVVPPFEVPSGLLADRWSRRGVLVLASVAAAMSVTIGGLSQNVPMYLVAAVFLGLFFAMQSGTVEPIVYDTILEEARDISRLSSGLPDRERLSATSRSSATWPGRRVDAKRFDGVEVARAYLDRGHAGTVITVPGPDRRNRARHGQQWTPAIRAGVTAGGPLISDSAGHGGGPAVIGARGGGGGGGSGRPLPVHTSFRSARRRR
jgi:hypothetical protein